MITKRRLLSLVCAGGLALVAPIAATYGQQTTANDKIVGNWKLVSLFTKETATGRTTSPLGEHPKGYLVYTPEGRMEVLMVHEKRSPPQADEDRVNLHKYMVAYSGRHTVEGEKVVHHVYISWNESWTGTDQVRVFKLEGDKLTITAPVDAIRRIRIDERSDLGARAVRNQWSCPRCIHKRPVSSRLRLN